MLLFVSHTALLAPHRVPALTALQEEHATLTSVYVASVRVVVIAVQDHFVTVVIAWNA